MKERLALTGVLILMGAGWGLSVPLTKVAVSGGYKPFGLVFWQLVIVAAILGTIAAARGRPVPPGPAPLLFCVVVAFLGTLLPDYFLYSAAPHLPAGVLGIVLSTVPIFAFPLALVLGNDRFSLLRLGGLACGFAGILLLIGPETSLPGSAIAGFVMLALLAPLCFSAEGNFVARFGTGGLDPIELLTGASVIGALIALPMAAGSGQWISPLPPYGLPDAALVVSAAIHAGVYATYVWMVGRAGSVFAAQVSYLVTGFGVIWSILLLGESYSGYVWASLGFMLAGIFLVQPRPRIGLAHAAAIVDDVPNQAGNGQS